MPTLPVGCLGACERSGVSVDGVQFEQEAGEGGGSFHLSAATRLHHVAPAVRNS